MSQTNLPKEVWLVMQERLGYSDEEMEIFKQNPRNSEVLGNAIALDVENKAIVFEVVESHGCHSQHTVGTRFFVSGSGDLITKMAPPGVCVYLATFIQQTVAGFYALWYSGIDQMDLRFNRGGCFDVGVRCGGWGNVILEAKAITLEEALALHQKSQSQA